MGYVQMFTHDHGRNRIALGHLSDSCDMKNQKKNHKIPYGLFCDGRIYTRKCSSSTVFIEQETTLKTTLFSPLANTSAYISKLISLTAFLYLYLINACTIILSALYLLRATYLEIFTVSLDFLRTEYGNSSVQKKFI